VNGPKLTDPSIGTAATNAALLATAARTFTTMATKSVNSYWTRQQYSHSVKVDLTKKEITIDCSCFMSSLLQSFLPSHHNEIISKSTTSGNTFNLKAANYYNFCNSLATASPQSTNWKSIPLTKADLTANAKKLNGAVLVWSTPPGVSTTGDTGHVMTTIPRDGGIDSLSWLADGSARVLVADSSNIQHTSDTRCLLSSCPSGDTLFDTNPLGQSFTSNCGYMPNNGPGRGYVTLGFDPATGALVSWRLAVSVKLVTDNPTCLMYPL
jgi:hypothetical protein